MTAAWVQTQVDSGVTSPGATTLTWSLLQPFTSGHALTGEIYYQPSGSGALVTGISDDAGNTYSVLGDSVTGTTTNHVALFGKANVSGAPTTISATFSASPAGSPNWMLADESSGANAVDASAMFNNPTTNTPTSGNLSPTTTADLLLAYYVPDNGITPTAGTGFTLRLVDTTIGLFSESKLLSSSTPVAGTFNSTPTAGIGVVGAIALSPSCVAGLRLLGVGCGIWAAKKIEENPIITRRRLILPPAIPISRDSEKKAKLYNQQGTPL